MRAQLKTGHKKGGWPGSRTGYPTPAQRININPHRQAPKRAPRESFWIAAPREHFTERCLQQFPVMQSGPLLAEWVKE